MKKETKKASVLETRWEIFRFLLNAKHHIPTRHHINLVFLKGCGLNTFQKYLESGHKLSCEAVDAMVNSPDCTETLIVWLQSNNFSLKSYIENIISKLGIETFLQTGNILPAEYSHQLLTENRTDLLLQYMEHIFLSDDDKRALLEMHNLELTLCFLKSRPSLSQVADALLTYNEKEVFETYFSYGNDEAIRQGIIATKSAEIFEVMLSADSSSGISLDEFKLLIQRNDLEMLNVYFEHHGLDTEKVQYVCDEAPDEIFRFFIKQGFFPADSIIEFSRLIKLNDRQLLMDYLKEYPFSRAKDEIQLLQSGDDELINIYFAHHQFKTESKTFILVNGLSEKYGVKLEDIPPRHWRAEALIFTSGNDELIEQYLFAGEAYSKGLTDFGEALLFTHGSLEILDAYMDSKCPSDFAQHAIVSCWNDGLLSLFLHKHNLTFCRKVTAEFLARADTDMALKYLQQIENLPHFLKDDCPEAVTCLCKKNDKKIYQFLLDNDIELDESDCILFAHSAPADLILQYADKFSLGEDAEAELFRRNDKALLQAYLQMYLLEPNNEILLLSLLDVDLIDMYSVEDLDDDTIDYLY